jgi:CheY-like chemotaxis protein
MVRSMTAHLATPSSELIRLTRNALAHLYDAAYLENHPLAIALDATARLDCVTRAQRLRRLLLDCVESLRPQQHDGGVPETARAYAILTYRYIDGMTMEEIAAKRALSERQAYRELERGLEAVAALVLEQIGEAGLGAALAPSTGIESSESQLHVAQAEVARLQQTVQSESLNPLDIVQGVRSMLAGLQERAGTRIDVVDDESWPLIVADRVMLRQALLNTFTYGLHAISPGEVVVTAVPDGGELRVEVVGKRASVQSAVGSTLADQDRVRLTVAEALIVSQGGRLEVRSDSGGWSARLWFPIVARKTILVIDDNQDLVALFRRYLAGHEVAVIGATDSQQAARLATERRPDVITLDVMMPNLDGWDVLLRLKSSPTTAAIPVIVCSVLDEAELALNLGASGYLTKPIQQPDLLAVLGPYLAQATPAM